MVWVFSVSGKPKKFCNSISVGAFLDEGDDISLEEIKNRQNAARTSITASAFKEGLAGAVGGLDFHILPISLHHHEAELIETAAEQDLLCSCGNGLPSPAALCKNGLCSSSSRDKMHSGEKVSPHTSSSSSSSSPSSALLSPVSNLLVEFERMSLQESLDNPIGCRERKSSGDSQVTDPGPEPVRLSLGHSPQDSEALDAPSWRTEAGEAEEKRSSGSSEEYFEAKESQDLLSRTKGSVSGGRGLCARSKSWDHGGRDLSSSGSSGSSYKSLDNSHEFFSRTPPHIGRGLFIDG